MREKNLEQEDDIAAFKGRLIKKNIPLLQLKFNLQGPRPFHSDRRVVGTGQTRQDNTIGRERTGGNGVANASR